MYILFTHLFALYIINVCSVRIQRHHGTSAVVNADI